MISGMSNLVQLPGDARPAGGPRGTGPLRDRFGRIIDHLRLSITSACDLRCVYCRPEGGCGAPEGRNLSNTQRAELAAFLHRRFGLAQVRITGGEPLLEKGVVELIQSIRKAAPRIEIAMTTNGRLLAKKAAALRAAGLDRLNVSLDALDASVHRRITGGEVAEVLRGLAAADAAGFAPPKLNTVVLRDLNDGEVPDIAAWALRRGHEIRFLEAMPIGPAAEGNRRRFIPARQIVAALRSRFRLTALPAKPGETARRYAASSAGEHGIIGIIAPVTEPFCGSCRRIRLTADGRLFPCLLDSRWVELAPAWAGGRFDDDAAERIMCAAAETKAKTGVGQIHGMVSLGG